MADKEYYSFEEVLKDLKLEENELKRLVSAGEIRAFRDKNTMRFKAEDVARLRGTTSEPGDVELDDLELDLDDAAPAPPAEDIMAEELILEDTPPGEPAVEVEEIELTSEETVETRPARGRAAREAATKRTTRTTVVEEVEPKDSPLVVGALLAGEVLLLIAAIVIFDAVTGTYSNPLSAAVANMFG